MAVVDRQLTVLVYWVICNTSAIFQPKMLVVGHILAVFFTYRDISAKPNISRNFLPAIWSFKKLGLGIKLYGVTFC